MSASRWRGAGGARRSPAAPGRIRPRAPNRMAVMTSCSGLRSAHACAHYPVATRWHTGARAGGLQLGQPEVIVQRPGEFQPPATGLSQSGLAARSRSAQGAIESPAVRCCIQHFTARQQAEVAQVPAHAVAALEGPARGGDELAQPPQPSRSTGATSAASAEVELGPVQQQAERAQPALAGVGTPRQGRPR